MKQEITCKNCKLQCIIMAPLHEVVHPDHQGLCGVCKAAKMKADEKAKEQK